MDLSIPSEHEQLAAAARHLLVGPIGQAAAFSTGTSSVDARLLLLDKLAGLGVLDLDICDRSEALAAGLVAVEAGAAASAIPLVPLLVGRAAGLDGALHAVGRIGDVQLLNHVDLGHVTRVLGVDGTVLRAEPIEPSQPNVRPLAAYASRVALTPTAESVDPWFWALHVTMSTATALGAARRGRELACNYVGDRVQFNQPIANFQRTRIRIADIIVDEYGLRELFLYTLWRIFDNRDAAFVDALMLRYQQLVATRQILSSVHQIHAAIGFCYEYPLVQLTLGLQLDRQLPYSEPACLSLLADRYDQVETHYEQLPPAWPLMRTDRVGPPTSATAVPLASVAT